MSRDPQRLSDVGANATPEERLLASLIGHHREARPPAAGLREIAKRAEDLLPPVGFAGRVRSFTFVGAFAAACVAIAVVGVRVSSPSAASSSSELPVSTDDARSEPAELAPAHEVVPVDMLPSEPVLADERAPAPPITAAPMPRSPGVARSKRSCDEAELIDRADTLLRTGQAARALEVTRLHAACKETVLDQERERIAIEALVLLGRHREAATRARAFSERYPSSPHLRRIRQLVVLGDE